MGERGRERRRDGERGGAGSIHPSNKKMYPNLLYTGSRISGNSGNNYIIQNQALKKVKKGNERAMRGKGCGVRKAWEAGRR